MYMTREEAVDVLYRLADNDILDRKITDAVEEIAMILRHEDEDDLSLWGAEDEATDLFIARREDLITPEWEEHCRELYEKGHLKASVIRCFFSA